MAESKKPAKAKSKVNEAGNYTKPELRKKLFNKIKAGTKGGDPGEWSARKAQLLASEYKKAGGGYKN
jgi:ABC-type transport system substrate-binding protein